MHKCYIIVNFDSMVGRINSLGSLTSHTIGYARSTKTTQCRSPLPAQCYIPSEKQYNSLLWAFH